jgi:hypothetical protein
MEAICAKGLRWRAIKILRSAGKVAPLEQEIRLRI